MAQRSPHAEEELDSDVDIMAVSSLQVRFRTSQHNVHDAACGSGRDSGCVSELCCVWTALI